MLFDKIRRMRKCICTHIPIRGCTIQKCLLTLGEHPIKGKFVSYLNCVLIYTQLDVYKLKHSLK